MRTNSDSMRTNLDSMRTNSDPMRSKSGVVFTTFNGKFKFVLYPIEP